YPYTPLFRSRNRITAPRERARGYNAADREREERDTAEREVQDAGRAHRRRHSSRRAGREAVHRIRAEHCGTEHPDTIERKHPSDYARVGSQHARETDRSREHHRAGQHEVQRLHPAAGTVRQYAQRVSTEVEAFTREALDDAETEIERAGDDAAGEECARAR